MSDMGLVVGGYQLVGRVGSGSTAAVWKAMDPGLGRAVALKQVPAAAVELLRAEAARLAQLDDPHVVQVYGFVEEAGAAYLVEEWIDGATLSEVLAAGGRLSVPQALGVVRGSLLGLAHAHSRGVVHGDVSTGNILVDVEGTSRLIDFGIGGSTPAYRSPEAVSGPLSPASDVYAAAAVLVHLLTGQRAPAAAPDLGKVDPGIRSVLSTALAADPASRYSDAAAFLTALEEAAEETYGAAWWTSAGVGALVAPAVATLMSVGGGSLAGGAAVGGAGAGSAVGAAATGRRVPWKMLVGAGIAAVVVVAGAVTAVALAGGDDSSEERRSGGAEPTDDGEQEEDEEVDPVVDTVPSGKFTFRQVVTKSDDPTWAKVGDRVQGIWTITPDCPSASDCGGAIKNATGGSFPLTWDGTALTQAVEVGTVKAECIDNVTGERTGPVTLRAKLVPNPVVYTASGPVDPDTGFASSYVGTYTYTERIVSYENLLGGPSRPRDCPFRSNGQIKHTATYKITITSGADPKVAKAERRRLAREKRQEGKR
ncbi:MULTISPECIES: serine/threonine-protein kinase [Nocardioides]|uniref:non-specific serine/threonine protein kinase n=1 Tax=Nocardioides vastitatis TaxID=2568655 RepID=A0ABW0Z9P9_9ACTN|nr:serine/threonine-protein kinase [Nocardioides sp.]THJ10511.1 serine/threonine protein kinase [Nocardioides sp.]